MLLSGDCMKKLDDKERLKRERANFVRSTAAPMMGENTAPKIVPVATMTDQRTGEVQPARKTTSECLNSRGAIEMATLIMPLYTDVGIQQLKKMASSNSTNIWLHS